MLKICGFFLIVFLSLPALPLAAQDYNDGEDETEPSYPNIDTDWDSYISDPYAKGDKNLVFSMGVLIPTIFTGKGMEGSHNISPGGTGSLAYDYFLNSRFFLGAEGGGMFAGTVGKNMLYMIPFGLRLGYQYILNRFEFPFVLMAGAIPQKYSEKGYFGLIVKPAASIFFRYNNDWSFGLNFQWWMVPQWPKDNRDVFGNFLELTLSARYHF
ncbi:MAG: hypothetical protein LBH43_14145 [Treponema sp.]|jgi:hypothetical protein|nr:hypothetical protein [Treponema sp.]